MTEYLLHVSVHEIETNEGDNLFTLRQEKIKLNKCNGYYYYFLILPLQCTETCQKYPVTVIFYYIFHIKPQFLKTLFQSQFLFDFDEIFTNRTSEARTYVIFCDYF